MDLILQWILTIVLGFALYGVGNGIHISIRPKVLYMEPGELKVMSIILSDHVHENFTLKFMYQEDTEILEYQKNHVISDLSDVALVTGQLEYMVTIHAIAAGEVILHPIVINTTEIEESSSLLVDVNIYNSIAVQALAIVSGWLYVLGWTLKFIPQIYLNWKTKSCEGLNLDYVSFNINGVIAYCFYNLLIYWVPHINLMYAEAHPFGVFPVGRNDVFVAISMLVISLIQAGQCFIYDLGGQKFSRVGLLLQGLTIAFIFVMLILTLYDFVIWLTFLTAMSYLKVISQPLKYTPQVIYNYRRKSTEGWSIYYVWLDTLGAVGSLIQMVLLAENKDDWTLLYGNFPKFSLGFVTLAYDIIFLCQHFIFYRGSVPYENVSGAEQKQIKPPKDTVKSEDELKSEKQKILRQ